MDDLVLTLAVRFLAAKDAFACSCVSSRWRAILAGDRDNGSLWKQVFMNSHRKIAHDELKDDEMDYRLFALGMWDGVTRKKKVPKPVRPTYTPTFGPDNYFAVVELRRHHYKKGNKRRKEELASWICPICPTNTWLVKKEMGEKEKLVFKGSNPFSHAEQNSEDGRRWLHRRNGGVPSPLGGAFRKAVCAGEFHSSTSLRITMTLFRRDNMKSVRLFDDCMSDDNEEKGPLGEFCLQWYGSDLQFSPTEEGMKAKMMVMDAKCIYLAPQVYITFSWKRLASEEEETSWLANYRRALEDRDMFHFENVYRPTREDLASLARIPHFEYELKSFESLLYMGRDNSHSADIEKQGEMLVALEGLCWE